MMPAQQMGFDTDELANDVKKAFEMDTSPAICGHGFHVDPTCWAQKLELLTELVNQGLGKATAASLEPLTREGGRAV